MERLTRDNFACPEAAGTVNHCPVYGACPCMERYNRLKAYEDTGLTPEQIDVIKPLIFTAIPIKRMLELAKADRENRVEILPCPGDVLYETDPAHGVVKHTVTDVHWVANTSAVDDHGNEWADYYTEEDIHTAHLTREAAEAVLAAGSIMEGYPCQE